MLNKNYKMHTIKVATAGDIKLEITAKGTHRNYENVKLVQKLDKSLLSIGQMIRSQNITVEFKMDSCLIKMGIRCFQ